MVAHNFIDLIGQKFGKSTVIKRVENNSRGDAMFECFCNCGNYYISRGSHLRSGETKSCGCLRIEKTIQRNKINKRNWTEKEFTILNESYINKGSKYCSSIIGKSRQCITQKAFQLGLKSNIVNGDKLQRKVIKRISDNRVVSICNIHGETMHYYNKKMIKIGECMQCTNIKRRKKRSLMKYRLIDNLRTLIRNSFKKIGNKNGNYIARGCFRNLDYTPTQLYNYLNNIKKLQENKCPVCNTDYNNCVMTIEHVIPLATAKTEQEIINLFDLKNLNLMCMSCNSSKNKKDYTTWLKEKKYVIK